jgi:hypothetical protein
VAPEDRFLTGRLGLSDPILFNGGDQDELSRGGCASERSTDRHLAVFKWLAQDFERLAIERGHLVQEQHALVGEADLPRLRRGPAADQAGVAH